MLPSLSKCLRLVQWAVMPEPPIAIRGLQVSIECLRLLRSRPFLPESYKFFPSFGTTTNGGSSEINEDSQLKSTVKPVGEGSIVVSSERFNALMLEMERLRERVQELECQMAEAMTMLTDQRSSMHSPSSRPPQVVWLYDSPLPISRESSKASVTDLEVPTPYSTSLDVVRAISPDPIELQYEVVDEPRKNVLGLDLFVDRNDVLSAFGEQRIGSHYSDASIQSVRSSQPDLLLSSPASLASQRSYPIEEDELSD